MTINQFAFLKDLSPPDLDRFIKRAFDEKINRLASKHDPELLARRALESGFSQSGEPIHPQVVAPGVIAMTGVVKELTSVKHRCTLFTIKNSVDDVEERWSWDENAPTYLYSETAKVDGVRRTVALHTPPDEAIIIMHNMTHDGQFHTRKSLTAWQVEIGYDTELDEPITKLHRSTLTMTKLPPPSNAEEI